MHWQGHIMVIKPDHSKHYKWGNDCDGWHLLNTASLSVIKERVPKGGVEEMHFHRKCATVVLCIYRVLPLFNWGKRPTGCLRGEAMHVPSENVRIDWKTPARKSSYSSSYPNPIAIWTKSRYEILSSRNHRTGPHGQHDRRRGPYAPALFCRGGLQSERTVGDRRRLRPPAGAQGGLFQALGRQRPVRGFPGHGPGGTSRSSLPYAPPPRVCRNRPGKHLTLRSAEIPMPNWPSRWRKWACPCSTWKRPWPVPWRRPTTSSTLC